MSARMPPLLNPHRPLPSSRAWRWRFVVGSQPVTLRRICGRYTRYGRSHESGGDIGLRGR